jgi:hypothetical protein
MLILVEVAGDALVSLAVEAGVCAGSVARGCSSLGRRMVDLVHRGFTFAASAVGRVA